MKFFIFYSIASLLAFGQEVSAQSTTRSTASLYFRNAEKEYNDQRYMYAIPFYRTSLKNPGKNDSLANLHIAESYWYIRNYDSALYYYKVYENKFSTSFFIRQKIAELAANKKNYSEAAAIYKQLSTRLPVLNPGLLSARLKGFSDPKSFLKDSLDYTIRLLKLNTSQQDFSPQYYKNGMVFVSNRYSKGSEKEFGWDGLPYAGIYRVRDTADLYLADSVSGFVTEINKHSFKPNDDFTSLTSNDNDIMVVNGMRTNYKGMIHRLEKFSDELNSKYNYGPLCFNKAGDRVYFTRNNLRAQKERYNLEICVASLENGKWTDIKVLPFAQKEYDYYHPALSSDEKRLFFCSNMPGGSGGSDIYYIFLGADINTPIPINIDYKINTAGNELFPTVKEDTLFFSSDGHPGVGGLDIYKTWLQKGVWQVPVNLNYPINSSLDDFGIIYNNGHNKGFFTSNRMGSDDIFVFENRPFRVQLEGTVLSRSTMRRLDSTTVIIFSRDSENEWIDSTTTDVTGNYQFPVSPGRNYTLQFSRKGYQNDSLSVQTITTEPLFEVKPMLLTPVTAIQEKDQDGDTIPDTKDKCPDVKGPRSNFGCPDIQAEIDALAKMIFFKTASAELSPAALKPLNEVVAYLSNYPNLTLYIEGHTDNKAPAAYNKDLSQRRAKAVKDFFVKKGFSAGRFTTAGFGLERPIADNSTEEGRAMNRRVAIQATFH